MRFLVDQNLPTGLLPVLEAIGHDAEHIKLRGLAEASDEFLWRLAIDEDRVVLSKDVDFVRLAQGGDGGALLRLSVGNCSNTTLYALMQRRLQGAVLRLQNGEKIVEISA